MVEPALPWMSHHGKWTEADLDAIPDDGNRYEVIDGQLYMTPSPGLSHQRVGAALFRAIGAMLPPGWEVLYEVGVRLPNGNVIPDVVVLRPEAPLSGSWVDARHVGMVVEVASPSTRSYDTGVKADAYADAGIPSYWRVDRGADGAVHVYLLTGIGEYTLHRSVRAGETAAVTEPFEMTIKADELLTPAR